MFGGLPLNPLVDLATPEPPGPADFEAGDFAVRRMALCRLLVKLQALCHLADCHDVAIYAAPHLGTRPIGG